MKKFIFLFSFIISTLVSFTAISQEEQQELPLLSEAELAQMLAPIALYPDSLLTHILISSTYPIEVIEAYRWLQKNDTLNATQISQAIENFDWDASVKALVPFEQILNRLSENLSWMQQLGDSFLEDETRILASIQTLRKQAKVAGNLSKMENMDVSYENSDIIIEPLEKEVIYVPYYDTRMVYGTWHWASFPPVYWRPSFRVNVNRYTPFHWHSGVHISFDYFFSSFLWNQGHVVVINPKSSHHYRNRRVISHGGYAKRWVHKPIHRKGVAYRSKVLKQKYYGHKVRSHQSRKSSQHVQGQFKQHLSNKSSISQKKATHQRVAQGHKTKQHVVQKHNQAVQKSVPRQRQESIRKQTNRDQRSTAYSVKNKNRSSGRVHQNNRTIKRQSKRD